MTTLPPASLDRAHALRTSFDVYAPDTLARHIATARRLHSEGMSTARIAQALRLPVAFISDVCIHDVYAPAGQQPDTPAPRDPPLPHRWVLSTPTVGAGETPAAFRGSAGNFHRGLQPPCHSSAHCGPDCGLQPPVELGA